MGVAVTEDAVYVSGHTQGSFPGFTNQGGLDSFVARFTLDGDLVWLTQFGTPGNDFAWKVGVTGSTVFVAGNTNGLFPGAGATPPGGDDDGFVAAFGTDDGQQKWIRQFGGPLCESLPSLATDREGVVVVGRTAGQGGECAGPNTEAIAQRLDVDGNTVWTMQFGPPGTTITGVALKGKSVYLVGVTEGDLGGPSAGGPDGYVMRVREKGDDGDGSDEDEEEGEGDEE